MKNKHQERLRILVRRYHIHHQWRLENGVYIIHDYSRLKKLSWWDDIGFILNGRRVMAWWVHPRMKYADAIDDMAWKEAGDSPASGIDIFSSSEKQWKKVGRSRKKVVGYLSPSTPNTQENYYAKFHDIRLRMESDGVDVAVRPSMSIKTYSWCIGIELCIPIEVRNMEEACLLAEFARRLIRGKTTLVDEFPGYQYARDDWLSETALRNQDNLHPLISLGISD